MTREEERLEQAKFYNDKGVKDPHRHFLRGAEWADSTMIDRACEWFEETFKASELIAPLLLVQLEDNFRKAMKGE